MKSRRLRLFGTIILLTSFVGIESASAAQPVSGITTTAYNEGTDKAAEFYNPLAVSNVTLTLPQSSVDTLNWNVMTPVYQHASVKITTADGVVTSFADIGVRLKGQATRVNLNGKAPLKLKFDAFVVGQKFMGLTRMTLNSMVQDPSFVHENSIYRLFRAMGVVAPRTTYSWVTLNGVDFGLYMNVESIDSKMLGRWLTPAHLYSSNCYGADITRGQSWCYDTNYGDTNRSDLNSAIATSDYDGGDWWREINKVADMTEVINLMATDLYTSNWDGYTDVVQNNYYLAFDTSGKFKIIPWGEDGAFPMDPSAQLDFLGRGPSYRNWGNSRSVLLRKCVAYEPCVNLLVRAEARAKQVAEQLDMVGFKNKIAAVINTAYISKETRSNADLGAAQYWQNWLDTFFTMRTSSLRDFLLTRTPEAPELKITGNPTVGSVFLVSPSTWDFSATLHYQWLKDGTDIQNATNPSYTIGQSDVSHRISVRVTASKPGLVPASVTSSEQLIINPQVASAEITGNPVVGGTLSASPVGSDAITVTYQWYRSTKAIPGETSATYTPTPFDYLKPIKVIATVSQTGFPNRVTTSQPVTVQAGTIDSPALAIAGEASMAKTLLLTGDVPAGTKAKFQWLNDGKVISGASKNSYTLKATDVSHDISAKLTLTRTAYKTLELTTQPVSVVPGTFTKQPDLTISGTQAFGKTLTGGVGSWDSGVKYSYQWLRDGVVIPLGISKTYKITALDLGHLLTFQLTVTKAGYTTVTKQSPPVLIASR